MSFEMPMLRTAVFASRAQILALAEEVQADDSITEIEVWNDQPLTLSHGFYRGAGALEMEDEAIASYDGIHYPNTEEGRLGAFRHSTEVSPYTPDGAVV